MFYFCIPFFSGVYDLTVHLEKIVRNFGRYHKYTLGTDLRNKSRGILEKINEANNARDDRAAHLLELRQELESFKVLARLCHESGAFASTRSYLHVAERITNLARQNEGWLKKTQGQGHQRQKAEEVGHSSTGDLGAVRVGQNWKGASICSALPGVPVSSLCIRPACAVQQHRCTATWHSYSGCRTPDWGSAAGGLSDLRGCADLSPETSEV